MAESTGQLNASRIVSYAGSTYGVGGIAATFYLVGRARHDERARETGLLGAEALIDSAIVVTALKEITQRGRPLSGKDRSEFFDGGSSFPSGHSIEAWSLAAVIANEYHDRPWVQVSAYGIAAAVSLSRMIRDDRGGYHLQLAGPPAIENVGKAVIGPGDEQHDPLAGSAVAHPPVHPEAVRDRGKPGLQSRQCDREVSGGEDNPHEEMAGFEIIELLRVENVLPVMGKECRNRGNDAGPVGAGQGQDELMIGHGAGWFAI